MSEKKQPQQAESREDEEFDENPLTTEKSGRDFADDMQAWLDDLEWRQAARDRQARIIETREDLKRSPAAVLAEWKAKRQDATFTPPQCAGTTKDLLGRLLLKCEGAVAEALATREASRFAQATQLAHAAVHLARTLDDIGVDKRQTRHTVKVEKPAKPRRTP